MKTFFSKPGTALVFAAAMVCSSAVLAASSIEPKFSALSDGAKKKSKPLKQKAASKAKKVQFLRGSEESASERIARLKRECKGGVNAGACAGYTR